MGSAIEVNLATEVGLAVEVLPLVEGECVAAA
jgi:hypothetical protein